jgi:lysozyme
MLETPTANTIEDWNRNHMALDPEYIDAIKTSEGYAPAASWDYKQYSSGYGTKAQPGDENIPQDQLKAVYEQRYQDELAKAAAHVESVNPNLPPGVKAALTSLTYNAGPGWSQSGLGDLVRAGDLEGAKDRFLQYNHAGGKVDPGLTARRQREAAWFSSPQQQPAQASPVAPANAPLSAPQAAPLNLIPPQAPPIFAPQPQSQPQQQAAAPAPFEQIPQMQAPPIFAPQRHQVDLSKLRAAFKAPTFFNRG